MASIYGQVNPPGSPSSFSYGNVGKAAVIDWNLNIGFLGGSSATINFEPLGGWFTITRNIPFLLDGELVSLVPNTRFEFFIEEPTAVPEGGFGGITFLVVAGLALLGRLVKK
ncbi:MAG: hypothetical protein ACK53X_07545 [Holosporales bacterium]